MLTLVLFEKCILNDKYQNIISPFYIPGTSGLNSLDLYLQSLTNKTINLPYSYYENSGEIIVELSDIEKPYNYNYMLAIEFNGSGVEILRRYCFINSIKVKNGCAYIEYKEDIFSSYARNIEETQDCQLINSRLCNYDSNYGLFNYRKLPIKYDGNNKLTYSAINALNCLIIVELQIYKLVSGASGNYSNSRHSMICQLMGVQYDSQNDTYDRTAVFSKDYLDLVIESMLKYISSTDAHIGAINPFSQENDDLYYYDIGNIYVIPQTYSVSNLRTYPNNKLDTADYFMYGNTHTKGNLNFVFVELKNNNFVMNELYASTISSDYKLVSFGPINNQIEIDNNGGNIPYQILANVNKLNFSIFISIQNKNIDITDNYIYKIHYDLISSSENSQRKIYMQLKNNSIDSEKYKLESGTAKGAFGITTGIGEIIAGGESGMTSLITRGIDKLGSGVIGLSESLALISKIDQRKTIQNQPIYSTSKISILKDINQANFYGGLYAFYINPDNEDVVKNTINNLGMKTFEYIGLSSKYSIKKLFDPYNATRLNANYDYIKLDSPNVYGKFTNEIANKLNEILESGIKIWYNTQFQEDNYINNLL